MTSDQTMTIGVIGCGNMGSALVRGLIQKGGPKGILCFDPDRKKLSQLARRYGVQAAHSNREVARAKVILLTVKPQQMEQVLAEIRPYLEHRPLLISIAAGIPTRWVERKVGPRMPVVRVMPNTPALVGAGISAIAPGRFARAKDRKAAERIFRSVGEVIHLPERLLNAVTAISGSGPAYVFYLMEQMMETAVRLGLPKPVARDLVLKTVLGAARLAEGAKEDPRVLRLRVTSKGGTTEAAFRVFARRNLEKILRQGIQAAAQRAKELAG